MPHDLAIRLRRAAFNAAIENGDLDAIAALLARDAVLVTGTSSTVITGRKAQLQVWRREFAAPDRAIYTRTPETILLSEVEPAASEHGRWQCVAAAGGSHVASGSYAAKWRRTEEQWVVEAEIYLTLE